MSYICRPVWTQTILTRAGPGNCNIQTHHPAHSFMRPSWDSSIPASLVSIWDSQGSPPTSSPTHPHAPSWCYLPASNHRFMRWVIHQSDTHPSPPSSITSISRRYTSVDYIIHTVSPWPNPRPKFQAIICTQSSIYHFMPTLLTSSPANQRSLTHPTVHIHHQAHRSKVRTPSQSPDWSSLNPSHVIHT